MSTINDEIDWAEKIGKPTFEAIAEMVAALQCDYERLEELRDERDNFNPDDTEWNEGENMAAVWARENPDDADELAEMEAAADECQSEDDARERIQEDPLSLQVRSGWVGLGDKMKAKEFNILLGTGGPATRIIGELNEHGEPVRARLEVQDWFKPWTEYVPAEKDTLLAYCQCFYFGD